MNKLENDEKMTFWKFLKNLEHIEIQVDGGVKLNNLAEIAEAGADVFVAGSAIYKAEDPTATISEMNKILSKIK